MIERPRFRACYRPAVVEGEGVVLLGEADCVVLEGRAATHLAPLLDGTRTTAEVVDALHGVVPPAEAYYVLMLLERDGYLADGPLPEPSPPAAFWELLDQDAAAAGRRLAGATVSVAAAGALDPAPFVEALREAGVRIDEPGDLRVAVAGDYLHPSLAGVNAGALASGRPWMLVKPVGRAIWLGPLFVPGETGCWECLAQRLRLHRPAEVLLRNHGVAPAPSTAALPSTRAAAFGLAATEVVRWLVEGRNERLAGAVVTLDLTTLQTRTHPLTRRPRCPACGAPGGGPGEPGVVLQPRRKHYTDDGGYRTVPPGETLARYGHHLSPLTGILPYLEAAPSCQAGDCVQVYVSGPTVGRVGGTLRAMHAQQRDLQAGKGKTAAQARASGLCEALERYSGLFQGDEPRLRSTYRALGAQAIHPNACMRFSEGQYRRRPEGADVPGCERVPEPFDEDRAVEWTPLRSLTSGDVRYLPTAYCYYEHPEAAAALPDSNGCAAGNTLEEAVLQGFLELVERDSVALWWYNRLRRPGVDLDSFDDPYVRQMQACYAGRLRRSLAVLDVTSDLGIPAFVAVSGRHDAPADVLMGFGCHLDPALAVSRALSELNQMLPPDPAAPFRDSPPYAHLDPLHRSWFETATLENQPYLTPDPDLRLRRACDFERLAGDDLLDDIEQCVARAARAGVEVLVLDQTRPDVGLPVVKVVAPGLRHFWRRLGPGRLYDVPVRMGWLDRPLPEAALNPIPMFL